MVQVQQILNRKLLAVKFIWIQLILLFKNKPMPVLVTIKVNAKTNVRQERTTVLITQHALIPTNPFCVSATMDTVVMVLHVISRVLFGFCMTPMAKTLGTQTKMESSRMFEEDLIKLRLENSELLALILIINIFIIKKGHITILLRLDQMLDLAGISKLTY